MALSFRTMEIGNGCDAAILVAWKRETMDESDVMDDSTNETGYCCTPSLRRGDLSKGHDARTWRVPVRVNASSRSVAASRQGP